MVSLAAAAIARRDVGQDGAAAGSSPGAVYGHLVPGYSRFRGLLEMQGFYPDPAVSATACRVPMPGAGAGCHCRVQLLVS